MDTKISDELSIDQLEALYEANITPENKIHEGMLTFYKEVRKYKDTNEARAIWPESWAKARTGIRKLSLLNQKLTDGTPFTNVATMLGDIEAEENA